MLYEERVNVERERHRQMVRDSTQKKIKMLVDRIELENSKGVAHPIKALHDENEFYENKKRLREIYELFMADRVKYKPCKYRTKLVKMVKICEPHSWTTKPAAKLWKRKTYKVYTREKNWDQTRKTFSITIPLPILSQVNEGCKERVGVVFERIRFRDHIYCKFLHQSVHMQSITTLADITTKTHH